MNIVLTGGTGYIGSHIALDLARIGHRVTAVARAHECGRSSSAEKR